jgi:hypothetical protein
MANGDNKGPAVPPEGGQPAGANPQAKVSPEGTRPIERGLQPSHETQVAPEATRTVVGGAAPSERTRLLPLDDSNND